MSRTYFILKEERKSKKGVEKWRDFEVEEGAHV